MNRALVLNGFEPRSPEEILSLIGLNLDSVCKELLNSGDQALVAKFREDVIRIETEIIPRSGELYPEAFEVLKNLHDKGLQLCICSNGNQEYVEAIVKKFGLEQVFSDIWYERKGVTKTQAVRILKEKFNAGKFVMVGDRWDDIKAAGENGGISIGGSYGFGGGIEDADYVADSIKEVENIITSIFKLGNNR